MATRVPLFFISSSFTRVCRHQIIFHRSCSKRRTGGIWHWTYDLDQKANELAAVLPLRSCNVRYIIVLLLCLCHMNPLQCKIINHIVSMPQSVSTLLGWVGVGSDPGHQRWQAAIFLSLVKGGRSSRADFLSPEICAELKILKSVKECPFGSKENVFFLWKMLTGGGCSEGQQAFDTSLFLTFE